MPKKNRNLDIKNDLKVKGELKAHKFDTDNLSIDTNNTNFTQVFNQSTYIGNIVSINYCVIVSTEIPIVEVGDETLFLIGIISKERRAPSNVINALGTYSFYNSSSGSGSEPNAIGMVYGITPIIIKPNGYIYIPRRQDEHVITDYQFDIGTISVGTMINISTGYIVGNKSDVNVALVENTFPNAILNDIPFKLASQRKIKDSPNKPNNPNLERLKSRKALIQKKNIENLIDVVSKNEDLKEKLKNILL